MAKKNNKKKYIMFIDETGSPDINNLDQPFSVIGVIFEYKYCMDINGVESELKNQINVLKNQVFGKHNLTLHLLDIGLGKREFAEFDKEIRKEFFRKLPDFMRDLKFSIISVTIDKNKLQKYYSPSKDPYVIAFTHVLQNYYSFISKNDIESARIIVESRDDNSNLIVQKAFFDVFNNGTTLLEVDKNTKDKIKGFVMAKKGDPEYISGLEIPDILCTVVSRARRGLIELDPKCMRKGEYGNENKIFAAVKQKIYCPTKNDEDLRNWGFMKVPSIKKLRRWNNDVQAKSS